MNCLWISSSPHPNRRRAAARPDLLAFLAIAILLGLFVAYPIARKQRGQRDRISCVSNLKNIGLAFRIFATDHDDNFPLQPALTNTTAALTNSDDAFKHFLALSNELATPNLVHCRADTERTRAESFTQFGNSNISYFIGLSAFGSNPQLLLAGDRNIIINGSIARAGIHAITPSTKLTWADSIHKSKGNILLSDGSVQQTDSARLQTQASTQTLQNLLFP